MERDLLNLKNSIISSLEYAKNLPNSERKKREIVNSSKILNFINEKIKFNPEIFIKPLKKNISESEDWIKDIENSTFLPKDKFVSIAPTVAKHEKEVIITPLETDFIEPDIENVTFINSDTRRKEDIKDILKRLTPLNVVINENIKNLEDYYEYSWTR